MSEHQVLEALKLVNARPDRSSRIAMVSLPVPLGSPLLTALGDLPTQVQPVGWWPESVAGKRDVVRRQLMLALSGGELPDSVSVLSGPTPSGAYSGPEMSCHIISKENTGVELSEVNEAQITFRGNAIGLQLGLRHAGEYHWWQWVRVQELWSGPLCKAVRAAGFIEVQHFGDETYRGLSSVAVAPNLHVHNWLRGDLYALMFANGVVCLTCRHVNNHLFDDGRDLQDVLPLISFTAPSAPALDETLDGARTRFDLGSILLNLDDASSAVSPDHPGALRTEGHLIICQPYEGVEIRGDSIQRLRKDGYICKAQDRIFPKGAARSLRFSLGMGEDAPTVTRLAAPDWWYALCGEFWPDSALPAHDPTWDQKMQKSKKPIAEHLAGRPRGFDYGIETGGWEGETPYQRMLHYYHSGDPDHFEVALNDSYHMADIGFDHATETIRMVGYPFGCVAPPLYRTVGMLFGYLETGDPYLLECAESAANHFFWIDTHNWPRRSYGRDAMSLRSLIFLWDYVQKEDYLRMARQALGRLITCQLPDGSYADQGGAVGGQGGHCNEIIKVWMAMMANAPVMDYLLRRPDDPELWQAAIKTGQFLLKAQLHKEGQYYWAYEYKYGDNPGNGFEMLQDPVNFQRHPTRRAHVGYKGRFLKVLTDHTGDERYFQAWQRFRATNGHPFNIQFTPYAIAHQWNARVQDGALRIAPKVTGYEPSMQAVISTPLGRLSIKYCENDGAATVETQCERDFPVLLDLPGSRRPRRISSNASRTFKLS